MLLKNHTNYIEDSIFKFSLKEYNSLFLKKKQETKQNKTFFAKCIMMESLSFGKEKIRI